MPLSDTNLKETIVSERNSEQFLMFGLVLIVMVILQMMIMMNIKRE
jgi:hypothetical protein